MLIKNYVEVLRVSNPDKSHQEIEIKLRARLALKGLNEGLLQPIHTVMAVQDYARLEPYKHILQN